MLLHRSISSSSISAVFLAAAIVTAIQPITINAQELRSYVAAVLEHAPSTSGTTPENTILENVNFYREYTQQAVKQSADIIVFPEYGLTGLDNGNQVDNYSIPIPIVIPTTTAIFENKILQELSSIALEHSIYMVVNLLEQDNNNTTDTDPTTYYYNTNIVYDREGRIIAKYRKINLFAEAKLTPGTELVTFTTDFGATFAIFTCFDILFYMPSVAILTNNTQITDVIFPTAWISHVPFYTSLSVQSGYSKAHNVNLLAANYGNPRNSLGGSGIYLADNDGQNTPPQTYIDGTTSSKLIVQKVTFNVTGRQYAQTCPLQTQNVVTTTPPTVRGLFDKTNISTFITPQSFDYDQYSFVDLSIDTAAATIKSVCHGEFCCSFNITTTNNTANSNETYKLVAYDGPHLFNSIPYGIRFCSLIACTIPDDVSTCGTRIVNMATKFTQISVTTTGILYENDNIDAISQIFYRPTTLLTTLQPISATSYCVIRNDNGTTNGGYPHQIRLATTTEQNQVLTFGIFGRTSSATISHNHYNLFIVLVVSFGIYKYLFG